MCDLDCPEEAVKPQQFPPKRMRQLQQLPDSLQSNMQKCKYLHNTTWPVSIVHAVSPLAKDWKCITDITSRKKCLCCCQGLIRKTHYFQIHLHSPFPTGLL